MSDSPREREVIDDPPPFLGTWPRVYAAVLIYLCALILLFYIMTRAFAP
jgi:hypothetical protein